MILGITGGSGSGKTTLLQQIETVGGVILDCDAIYHRLLQEDAALLQAIDARFPNTVENGVLDRKKLGEMVFCDGCALQDLNEITHSAVKREILQVLAEKPAIVAIDAIGLFESGLDALCDVTIAVTAPQEQRIQRLMERENISRNYAQKRIAAQHSDNWYQEKCTYTLENSDTLSAFEAKCIAFLKQMGIMKSDKSERNHCYDD